MKTKLWIISVILAGLWGLGLNNNASAQLLFEENFDYTVGTLLTANGWAAHSGAGTNSIDVVSPGLSFPGYICSDVGYAAALDANGEDVNDTIAEQISGVLYTSLLVKVNGTSAPSHFFHFGQTAIGTNFFNRIWVNASGTGLSLGVGTAAPSSYITITTGNTYLIVMKFDFATKQNQMLVLDTFPTSEPAVYHQSVVETATFSNIGRIALRQFDASENIVVDGIRVGNTWADVVAPAVVIPDITPPVVDTAFATSLSTVKVVFNEVVDNVTAETITNYTGLAGIGTAVLNTGMDTVTLTLSTPLLDNVADTVCIANVEDTAGNVMTASQCFRLIFTVGDLVPPVVDTAWAENLSTVKVVFNEAMDNVTAETTSNYTGLPGISTAVLNTSMDTVTLTLSSPLTFGIPDTLIVNNVEDTAGNAMAAAQSFRVIYGVLDVTPPTVINAWPADLATVKVKFSEAMDDVTAETLANYTGLAGIGTATLNATLDTVTLALSTHLISGIADTLYIQNVEDTAGNAMAAPQMFELFLDTSTTLANLVITEIMYNPAETNTDTTEFIEILNDGSAAVNLMNYTITCGAFSHTIATPITVNPGERFLISSNAAAASNFYGVSIYQGNTGGLSNNGTFITIKNASGVIVDSVMFDDASPWPTAADQGGYSLSLCDPSLDNNNGANWGLGTVFFATVNSLDVYADPGQGCVVPVDNIPPVVDTAFATNLNTIKVVFNEVVDNITSETIANYTGLAGIGAASLNATMDTVTLTLSTPLLDNVADTIHIAGIEDTAGNVMATTQSFRLIFSIADIIPPTVINAWPETHAVVKVKFSEVMDNVTAETVANYTGLAGIGSASLNATMDTVTLALSTNLINGVSDTLYIQNVEDTAGNAMTAQQMFVLMLDTVTIPKALVITEIMYNPAESGTDSTEFIEIYNNDVVSVDLMNYVLKYGSSTFTFPTSHVIAPGEYALVSSNAAAASNFYGETFIQGSTGGIGNGGSTVVLLSPSGLLVDTVSYDDASPWSTLADEGGYSLSFCDPDLDNNVAGNWSLGTVFFGTVNSLDVYADPGQGCVTPVDTVPPVALHASLTNLTTAVVTFNESLNMTSAQTTSHYTGLGTVSSAVLSNDTVVTLTLATALVNAQSYTLSVTGISDLESNVMTITYEFPLMLDTTTSISEMTNAAIQIFPNPANDVITVTGTATANRIEVYNNMGMLVLSREADGDDLITIETSTLENGSYYINIRMNDGAVVTRPVVIIR